MFLTLATRPARAQQFMDGGEYNSCVSSFYDREMYNWLSYRNDCNEPVYVVICTGNTNTCGRAMEIRPGRHDSTGMNSREVAAAGEMSTYVCRLGYVPVDANNRYVSRPNQQFRCKNRGY